ncbi:hypothetical protein NC651_034581 [Populus alba x Populus x berolinensis]|nr:hypothetical protein NC651_034581 [Populus alba x Populus x berolinensis]
MFHSCHITFKQSRKGRSFICSLLNIFDKDSSGYITIDELQQACNEFGMEDVHWKEMIREVDQDNDGLIDYNEFLLP